MRLLPLCCALLAVAGCAGQTPPAQAPVPIETAPVVATPTPAPTATPTAQPTATPTPAPSGTPAQSPSPEQLEEVPEAAYGPDAFPSPLVGGQMSLSGKTVAAGAGNATARGASDGNLYTQWAARQGVADNVWWAIDLGSVRTVSRLDLLADASPESTAYFTVEVSDDYEAWETVGSGKAYASNERPRWGTVFLPTGTKARYVRLVPTNWARSWVAVWEIRLY